MVTATALTQFCPHALLQRSTPPICNFSLRMGAETPKASAQPQVHQRQELPQTSPHPTPRGQAGFQPSPCGWRR